MELKLQGRRVLVTGGSQGIGYAVADGFLEEGCSVVIVAKNELRLQSAVERLSKYGADRISSKALDLSCPGAASALADEYSDTDILINNAGAIPAGDIFEVDEARWREVVTDQPLGRSASPKEIADVVVFLASDRAGWICGEVVNLDAGNIYRHNQF
jgi:NAD(P)-dependent dehydrogenase (short-subunit alcohol dehydrogenase family)